MKTATKMVADKTGMKIGIDRLRLKFPLDLSLSGVRVIEASGDTMALAREAIVDLKLRTLLALDAQINRLSLLDGYYRMLSTDSSMLMTIKAGLLEVDVKSSFDLKSSEILINKAKLKDGAVNISLDVWKQQATTDTTSTPFYIKANTLVVEDILFTMSMLPTIDTLRFQSEILVVYDGVIDLKNNDINISRVDAMHGDALMLAPSQEYVQNHPAPLPDTTAVQSPPMTIAVDTISLDDFNARYAVADTPPVKGFETNDIR